MALEHVASGMELINEDVLEQLINRRLKRALIALVEAVEILADRYFDRQLPVIMHGYGYPVPDGRGFSILGGWGPLPGPWLEPSFARKGVIDEALEIRKAAMRQIVMRFNTMINEVADLPSMEQLHVTDVVPSCCPQVPTTGTGGRTSCTPRLEVSSGLGRNRTGDSEVASDG